MKFSRKAVRAVRGAGEKAMSAAFRELSAGGTAEFFMGEVSLHTNPDEGRRLAVLRYAEPFLRADGSGEKCWTSEPACRPGVLGSVLIRDARGRPLAVGKAGRSGDESSDFWFPCLDIQVGTIFSFTESALLRVRISDKALT